MAHVPKRFFRNVGALIGIVANVQGVMPFEVESKLFDRLFVREVETLLQEHQPQHRVEFFGWCSVVRIVIWQNLNHWKIR